MPDNGHSHHLSFPHLQERKRQQEKEIKETEICVYANAMDAKGDITTIHKALSGIKTGNPSKGIIQQVRRSPDKDVRNRLKKKLRAYTWAGLFSQRSKDNLIESSFLACLDFDGVKDVQQTKATLTTDPFVFCVFLSPSGTGLKVLIKIPSCINDKRYQEHYGALLEYFAYFNPDQSTKDISRLCFDSYDPDIHVNYRSHVFSERIKIAISPPKEDQNHLVNLTIDEATTLTRVYAYWKKRYPFHEGSRNNNLFILARRLCEHGVSEASTLALALKFQGDGFGPAEINSLVKSAYMRTQFNIKSIVSWKQ